MLEGGGYHNRLWGDPIDDGRCGGAAHNHKPGTTVGPATRTVGTRNERQRGDGPDHPQHQRYRRELAGGGPEVAPEACARTMR